MSAAQNRISVSIGRFDLDAAVQERHYKALVTDFGICINASCDADLYWKIGSRWTSPVPSVQRMLHNLGFDSAFREWRNTLQYPPAKDDERSQEVISRCQEVYRLMNQLAACYLQACPANQLKFWHMLPELMNDVESGVVGSAGVVYELLLNNDELVRLLPKRVTPFLQLRTLSRSHVFVAASDFNKTTV